MGITGRQRGSAVTDLATHPQVAAITGILGTLPHLITDELTALAGAFTDSPAVTAARAAALDADVPLVVDVLAAFSAVAEMYTPELTSTDSSLEPALVRLGLHAVCDAVAGAYAAPTIGKRPSNLLLGPWRAVLGDPALAERHAPDLGPRPEQVDALLRRLRGLRTRCHDEVAAETVQSLLRIAHQMDVDAHAHADDLAARAAHLTSRQRLRVRLRRQVAQALLAPCPSCGGRPDSMSGYDDLELLVPLCFGAVQALLVADVLPPESLELLLSPLQVVGV